jgi:sortase A
MKKVYAFLILLLLIVNVNVVNAYTKSDIIELSKDFVPCDDRSKSFFNGVRSSYTRIFNERDISDENLNKIYNNMKAAKTYAEKNGYCKIDQKDKLDQDAINYLKNLYETTNEILMSSPRISDGKIPEENIVIDLNSNTFEIYEDGNVSEVIEVKEVLNHVGLNSKYIIVFTIVIISLIVFSIFSFILYKKKKRSPIIISFIYVNIFLFVGMFLFRNEISIGFDLIDKISMNENASNKEIKTSKKSIISYPSYGEKYATIKIKEESGDIYFGDSSRVLAMGLGQSSNYGFIGEDKTVISGHNTGFFKNLLNVKEDEEILVETVYGKFNYKVKKIEIVGHTEISKLEEDYDLILYTCYPLGDLYGDKRIIVFLDNIESRWVGDDNEE